jgi:hypothetical protein
MWLRRDAAGRYSGAGVGAGGQQLGKVKGGYMPDFVLTPEMLAGLTGAVISLFFNYFPWLKDKFAGLASDVKSFVMIGMMAVVTAAITALSYYGVLNAGIEFTPGWPWHVVWVFVLAVVGNAAAFIASPQTKSVKLAKAMRNYDECQEMYLEARGEE